METINEQDMQTMGRGHVPTQPDYRFVNLEHLAGAAPDVPSFPASYHIDYSQVPDLFQRKIGACTNHAFAEIAMHRQLRTLGAVRGASPRFTYTLSKIEDKIADTTQQGTYPVMPFKIAVKYGVATEATVPNDTTLDFDSYIYHRSVANMPQAAFTEADGFRIPGYAQVGAFNNVTESQLKQAVMHAQDGVSICMQVGKEWYTSATGIVSWASKDILPIRKVVDPESGHDVTVTGWATEDGTGRCKIFFRNHWSLQWADGDNGWFYLDQHTISEAWIVAEIPDPLLAIIKSLPSQQDFHYTFGLDLPVGATGVDVQNLQIALKILGVFPFPQPVSTYYGNITKAAVMAFQNQYGVASPAEIAAAGGKLGPKTRAALNKIFSHN